MQAVDRLNGMVCTALPVAHTESEKEVNNVVVAPDMALRLANLTKSLSVTRKIHRKNGLAHLSNETKTEATPTTQEVTSSTHPVVPSAQNFINRHCSSVVQSSSARLSSGQTLLEQRLKVSLKKLRHSQLRLSHHHSKSQIKSYKETKSCISSIVRLEDDKADSSNNTSMESCSSSSMDPSFVTSGLPSTSSGSAPYPHDVSNALQQHLQCLESFVDDEATSTSSDEEEELDTSQKAKSERYFKYVI